MLNLTDTQIDVVDTSRTTDNIILLKNTITELVNQTQPDLITISGDMRCDDSGNLEKVYTFFVI